MRVCCPQTHRMSVRYRLLCGNWFYVTALCLLRLVIHSQRFTGQTATAQVQGNRIVIIVRRVFYHDAQR